MKIAYLCPEIPFPIYKNGGTLINYHLLKYLSRIYEIDLITFYSPDYENYKKDISKICNEHFLVEKEKPMNSLKRRILSTKKGLPGIAIDISDNMKSKMISIFKIKNYDLIFCDSINMGIYSTYINNNIPKIIAPHDSLSLLYKTYSESTSNILKKLRYKINEKLFNRYEKEMYKYYNACFFVSEKDAKYVKSFLPDRNVFAIPNGVDLNYYYPNKVITEEKNTLIFTGVMNYVPNIMAIQFFIKNIFPIVLKNNPHVKLYIVGKNPEKSIRKLDNRKNIVVTGFVNDIREYVWRSSVYISPLISGAGIKNKVLQAMAMGKPIVATPLSCDGIKEIMDGKNVLIREKNKNFAQAILLLLQNKKLRDRLKKEARKTVEKYYSWNKTCKQYEYIIEQLVSKNVFDFY